MTLGPAGGCMWQGGDPGPGGGDGLCPGPGGGIFSRRRRPPRTSFPAACRTRKVFGSALARSPSRAMSRSQDSKAAAIKAAASHAEFIAKSCEGNRPIPQSFPVRMQSSTRACTRWAASM